MRLATYWYVLIEIEGYTENQVVEVLANDKAKCMTSLKNGM